MSHGSATAAVHLLSRGFADGHGRGYQARIATDAATRADAYALRYESYLAYGHIAPNPARSFCDKFDAAPNATTLVVYNDGTPVASVRACLLRRGSAMTSPARETFPAEIEALLAKCGPERPGIDGLEINRLVRSPAAANDQKLVFMLFRLVGRLALLADFRVVVLCVRQNHVPFYKRISFQEESELRDYPGLSCPMRLLSCSRLEYDAMRADNRLMDPDACPPGALDGLEHGRTVRPLTVGRG